MNTRDPKHGQERDPLREALAALPREAPPGHDLWPEISARLGAQQQPKRPAVAMIDQIDDRRGSRQPWRRRLLLAGGLAAAMGALALISGLPSRAPSAAGADDTWRQLALAALAQEYDQVHADALAVLTTRCAERATAGCADLRTGLDELDRSIEELRQAITAAPAGSPAGQWLAARLQRQLSRAGGLSHLAGSLL